MKKDPSTANSSAARYEVGEKVFVDHEKIYYEAKVLNCDSSGKVCKYTIHYLGWNSRYDETITEEKILKHDEASIKKAKELEDALTALEKGTPSSSKKKRRIAPGVSKDRVEQNSSRTSSPSLDGSGKPVKSTASTDSGGERKRKAASRHANLTPGPGTSRTAPDVVVPPTVEDEARFRRTPEIQVKMPDDLKPVLVEDWDMVSRQLKLVSLPAKFTVDQILDEYLQSKRSAGGTSSAKLSTVKESVDGIREYFNAMLGTQLLYKFERPQYADLVHSQEPKKHSQVYGSVHLLRLFVRLGHMLAYTSLSETHVSLILSHVHDFLKFLSKNKARLFDIDDYVYATMEYQRRSFS